MNPLPPQPRISYFVSAAIRNIDNRRTAPRTSLAARLLTAMSCVQHGGGPVLPYGTLGTARTPMAGSFRTFLSVAAVVAGLGCVTKAGAAVTGTPFGTSPDGKAVQLFSLKNGKGMEALIMSWGGTI